MASILEAVADDPLAVGVLAVLNGLIERQLRVTQVLSDAVRALENLDDPQTTDDTLRAEFSGSTINGGPVEPAMDLQVARDFQQRLEEVFGVAKVTLDSSGPSGFRFLVEMEPVH